LEQYQESSIESGSRNFFVRSSKPPKTGAGYHVGPAGGRLAINTLLARTRDLQLAVAPGKLRWRSGFVLRELQALPVSFRAASPTAVRSEPADAIRA
jgi:hypothetical protein